MPRTSITAVKWLHGWASCQGSTPLACKSNLLGMSKRGDTYLRTLLIHGARSVIYRAGQRTESCPWINSVVNRRNKNVAAVALANKNARIVWALLAHDRHYQAGYVCGGTTS